MNAKNLLERRDMPYVIYRNYFISYDKREIIDTDLTLKEAQAYCKNKETSYKTCTS